MAPWCPLYDGQQRTHNHQSDGVDHEHPFHIIRSMLSEHVAIEIEIHVDRYE
jgi:hypothetical protein